MKAIRLHGYGGLDQLRYEDAPQPVPGPDEVLVKVAATSVNPVDWKIREGAMKDAMPIQFPDIPGRDAAGEVVETGANVHSLKPGDRVLGMVQHGFAEYVTANAAVFASIPAGLSTEQAGVIPLVVTTGAQLIEVGTKIKSGESVLVTGALGAVGRTAVYAAKSHGARVIAGVRGKQKEEAKTLGADQVVALDDDADLESLKDLDAIADTVGGDTATKLIPKLKRSGVFASVLGKPKNPNNSDVRFEAFFAQPDAALLSRLAEDVASGKLVIPIAKTFKLADGVQAEDVAQKGVNGKVCLVP